MKDLEGQDPALVATGANFKEQITPITHVLRDITLDNKAMLLLFGTGWGLSASLCEQVNYRLPPLFGRAEDGYNHLSVRSAMSITLDRLLGS